MDQRYRKSLAISIHCGRNAASAGFTLIELLVVTGIAGVLIGILLPALSAARGQAQRVRCLSNIRQLGVALREYASDSADNYPINVSTPSPKYWWDADRLGHYLPLPSKAMESSVFWCPSDDGGQRSYSMNVWASSAADRSVTSLTSGQLWPHKRASCNLLLLAESWSYQLGSGTGFLPTPFIGRYGATAGQRFGAEGGIGPIDAGNWGPVSCELVYARHRGKMPVTAFTQSRGRVSICFDDGHAALCSDSDLVNSLSGNSTGLAAWSTIDYIRN